MRSPIAAALVAFTLILAPVAAMAEPVPPPAPVESTQTTETDPLLEAEHQQKERRETQLAWHQGLAIGALVMMATTAVLGQVLTYQKAVSPDQNTVNAFQAVHVVSAATTTALYGSAATLALMAPPPTQPAIGSGGFDPVALHRGLTWLHAGTLGATVALGLSSLFQVPGLAPAHQILAYTTTGLMAISGGLIVFNF
jgi:hypothetical protein